MSIAIRKLRQFLSAISEQILYYAVLIISLMVWSYFESGYVAIVVFIIGVLLAWLILSKISGNRDSD